MEPVGKSMHSVAIQTKITHLITASILAPERALIVTSLQSSHMSDGDVDGETARSAVGSGARDLAICWNIVVSPGFALHRRSGASLNAPPCRWRPLKRDYPRLSSRLSLGRTAQLLSKSELSASHERPATP